MKDVNQQYIELLERKLEDVNKLLSTTQNVILTGDETCRDEEAEKFIALYNRRENIITRIKKIDMELTSPIFLNLVANKEVTARKAEIAKEIKAAAAIMMEIDKKNIAISKILSAHFKKSLKQTRERIALNNVYTDGGEATTGYYFDSQN